jgi:hypothetical protein
MRIRWVNHPNPKLQHLNGIIQHEPYQAVAPFLLSGACEVVPYKNYLEELDDNEAQRIASLTPQQRAAFQPVPKWQVEYEAVGKRYIVARLHFSEKLIYAEAMPFGGFNKTSAKQFVDVLKTVGCPKDVIEHWQLERNKPDYLAMEAQRIEQDREANLRQQEREKHMPKYFI